MAEISGRDGFVMYGTVVLAEMVEWSMSGFAQTTIPVDTPFGAIIKTYLSAKEGDPGTVAFNGNWDPADTYGQKAVNSVCQGGTALTNLYLYANTSTYWRVASGGNIIVTRAQAVTLPRTGIGKISFEGQVSGAAMELIGTGS